MKRAVGAMLAGAAVSVGLAAGCAEPKPKVQRFGAVIEVKKEAIPEYKRLHAETWPSILQAIREGNIRNYSIFLKEIEPDRWYLFAYYEYIGTDIEADMRRVGACQAMQDWRKLTDAMQKPLAIRGPEEWWAQGQEVFHTD